MTLDEPERKTKILAEADVIVCGAGVAGVCAAVASARSGASTILIERYGFAGGMATAAMVGPIVTFHNKRGDKIVAGLADEVIERLKAKGGAKGHFRDTVGVAYSLTPVDSEILKDVFAEMLKDSGVKFLTHTWFADTLVENNFIKAVFVETKKGRFAVSGRAFIDSSGDADVAYRAGAPTRKGRESDNLNQPMTLIFKVGNVDISKVRAYIKENPQEFHHETLFDEIEKQEIIGVSGYFSLWKEGNLPIPRDRLLFFSTLNEGEVLVNTVRVSGFDSLDPVQMAEAEYEGRKQMWMIYEFLKKKISGFENCRLAASAPQIGVRESRRIIGRYILTADDIVQGRNFPDCIAKGAFAIDIHKPVGKGIISRDVASGGAYDIPYRSLLPQKIENLIAAGRCFSAEFEAHSSARVQATAMAMGQAAGTAAALAAGASLPCPDVDIKKLQDTLRAQGAIV